jgi:hypothetical protein
MDVLYWNINQRGGCGKGEIPLFVGNAINKSEASVIVLSEFIRHDNRKAIAEFIKTINARYVCYCNGEHRDQNGILIAVKRGIESTITVVYANCLEDSAKEGKDQPDFYQLNFVYEKKELSLIGTRIKVRDGEEKEEYKYRRRQLSSLIDHIANLGTENVIVVGDFNNSYIRGKVSDRYIEAREEYRHNGKGKPCVTFDTYNYQILKDCFSSIGMCLYTPEGNAYSWGFNKGNKYKGYIKNDHIASRNLRISNVRYDPSFISECEEYLNTKGEIDPPCPDHAILRATIKL